MTLKNAINEVRKSLPSEMRIHPSVSAAVKTLLEHAERTEPDKLIDAITNMIDENIRKSRCETYEDWQAAVEKLIQSNVKDLTRPEAARHVLRTWRDAQGRCAVAPGSASFCFIPFQLTEEDRKLAAKFPSTKCSSSDLV